MKTYPLPFKNLFALFVLGLAAPIANAQFVTSTGFDYTTGKYGLSSKTEVATLNLTGEYSSEGWTAKIVAPYERVTSPEGVFVVNGHPRLQKKINAQNQGKTQTKSGFGDIETFVSYNACHDLKTDWSAVFTGSVKLPTADAKNGLGTGKTDYELAFDLLRSIGRLTPSIGFGYHIVGNPTGDDLRNYFYASIGADYWITDETNLNLTFESDQRSGASSNVDNEISLGLNHHLAKNWAIEAHVLVGLSTSAPDLGLGTSVRFTF